MVFFRSSKFKFSHLANYLWFLIKWTFKFSVFSLSTKFSKSGHKIHSRDACQIFVTNLWQMCYRNTWYVASLFKPSVVDYGFGWYLPLTRLIYQMVQKILPELRKLRKVPVIRKFRVEKINFRFSRYSCNKYPKFFDFTHVTMLNIL